MNGATDNSAGHTGRPDRDPEREDSGHQASSLPPSRQLELEVSLLRARRDFTSSNALASESPGDAPAVDRQPAGAVVLLVVEGDDMRQYLRGCLAHETTDIAEILEAGSVQQARKEVADQVVDILIADYADSSDMGTEFYRSLQAVDGFRGIPAILVVDEPIPAELRRDHNPSLRILTRPFNASRLCNAVRSAVGMEISLEKGSRQ